MIFWPTAALPIFWVGVKAINVLLSSINILLNQNNNIAPRRFFVNSTIKCDLPFLD